MYCPTSPTSRRVGPEGAFGAETDSSCGGASFVGVLLSTVRIWGKLYALKAKQIAPAHWRAFMDRLSNSSDALERESVWLGLVDYDRSPILYPVRKLFGRFGIYLKQ